MKHNRAVYYSIGWVRKKWGCMYLTLDHSTSISVYTFLSFYHYILPSFYASILPFQFLPMYLSIYLAISLSSHLSGHLYIHSSIYPFIHSSITPSIQKCQKSRVRFFCPRKKTQKDPIRCPNQELGIFFPNA